MFNDIGGKIKTLAKVMCWLGIIGSVVYAVYEVIVLSDYITDENMISFLFRGLAIAGIGSLLSWIGSFITYGFGQLVENSDILVEQLYEKNGAYDGYSPVAPIEKVEEAPRHKCPMCGSMISEAVCPYCGYSTR